MNDMRRALKVNHRTSLEQHQEKDDFPLSKPALMSYSTPYSAGPVTLPQDSADAGEGSPSWTDLYLKVAASRRWRSEPIQNDRVPIAFRVSPVKGWSSHRAQAYTDSPGAGQ
ncbi:hypothetical protein ACTG9Q_15565 [Actinokineospora sp. 24-640]